MGTFTSTACPSTISMRAPAIRRSCSCTAFRSGRRCGSRSSRWPWKPAAGSWRPTCPVRPQRGAGRAVGVLIDRYADLVAALVDELGLGRVVLVGLSMGGYIARPSPAAIPMCWPAWSWPTPGPTPTARRPPDPHRPPGPPRGAGRRHSAGRRPPHQDPGPTSGDGAPATPKSGRRSAT